MKLGLIGLGRMGSNLARRLARAGTQVVAFDRSSDACRRLADETGVAIAADLDALIAPLPAPRIVWLMLPAGDATQQVLDAVVTRLAPDDVVIDGGNAYYRDSQRRAAALAARGMSLVDAGVSGGVWGLQHGYGLMVGGARAAIERITPLLQQLAPAPDRGWIHCGASGAGHFAKMIHNGIEYGMMQALAEGLALLDAKKEFGFDVAQIAQAWRDGTVIRSWLLDLTAELLRDETQLARIAPQVADSGEGRWTVQEAIDLAVPAPVITLALMTRFASRGLDDNANRLLALMRHAFGGHPIAPAQDG